MFCNCHSSQCWMALLNGIASPAGLAELPFLCGSPAAGADLRGGEGEADFTITPSPGLQFFDAALIVSVVCLRDEKGTQIVQGLGANKRLVQTPPNVNRREGSENRAKTFPVHSYSFPES